VVSSFHELFRLSQQSRLLCGGAQFNTVENERRLSRKCFQQVALGECQVLVWHTHRQDTERFALSRERQMQRLRAGEIVGETPGSLPLTKCPISNSQFLFRKRQRTIRMRGHLVIH